METPIQPQTNTQAPIQPVVNLSQPISSQPTPIPQQMTNLPESNNKKLLIAVLGMLAVGAIVAVLIFLNNRSVEPTNTNPAPVISDSMPEADKPAPASIPGATTFEGKMFNVSFEYSGEITDDQTTKVTYTDGTEKCFLEEIKSSDLNLVLSRGVECMPTIGALTSEESYTLISKDGKTIDMELINDNGTYSIRGSYGGIYEGGQFDLVINFSKGTAVELKERASALIATLSYDITKLNKTDRGDTIVDSGITL